MEEFTYRNLSRLDRESAELLGGLLWRQVHFSVWVLAGGEFSLLSILGKNLEILLNALGTFRIANLCIDILWVYVAGVGRAHLKKLFFVLVIIWMGKGYPTKQVFRTSFFLWQWSFTLIKNCLRILDFQLFFFSDVALRAPHSPVGKPGDRLWSIPRWSRPPWNLDSLSHSQGSSFQVAGTSSCRLILPNPRHSYWWAGGSGIAV